VGKGDRFAGDEIAPSGSVQSSDDDVGGVPDIHPLALALGPGGEAAAQDVADDLVAFAEVRVVRS
jgi:hypothetical protein